MTTNKPDSAIFYANKGLEVSQIISQKKTILDAATMLSELYEYKDTKQALSYLKIANAYKDSLFGTSNIQAMQVIASQEEERQKQIEATKMQYQNQLKQYALIAGLAILFIIAFILFRNNRQKQKTNKVLETTLVNLKSTQAQLVQSEKMASLGELTAGIAHEIQNPLNFVNNFSEVNKELLEELEGERSKVRSERDEQLEKDIIKDIKENEEKINHHGKRADAIVKGMLQHSRTSTGQKEPADINALCDEYLRLSYHGLRAKDKSFNAEYKTDFDETIGKINVVPQDIGRVLLNIINNAFYAVNERLKVEGERLKAEGSEYVPIVTIVTKRVSDKTEIIVKDDGNGIPQSIADKIFQPFFTTKPTGQGTGLGLSLAYDIIKAHGGEIKVETKEGEGSEFIIQLPMK
jgi:signal transduction histidine kinase